MSRNSRRKRGASCSAAAARGIGGNRLIVELNKEVAALHFADIAAGLGAQPRDGSLGIRCLGRDFLMAPDGTITAAGPLTPWMRILLLHYVRTRGNAAPTGTWVSFSELRSGLVKAPPSRASARSRCASSSTATSRGPNVRSSGSAACGSRAHLPRRVEGLRAAAGPGLDPALASGRGIPSKLKVLFDVTADRFLDVSR